MLRLAPVLTLALFLAPVAAGLLGTLLPAFNYLPALGGVSLALHPWRDLLAWPGLPRSLAVTLLTGFGATILSLLIATLILARLPRGALLRRLHALLPPLLATPHAAMAIGLAFLIAPSGWLARMVSPWATGWDRPPDLLIVQDSWGLALTAGLVLKEVPYLLLVGLAALGRMNVDRALALGASLGYAPRTAWLRGVLPGLYAQLRLPVYAVLAFSLSVVDVALILGPSNPPTLGPQILRWFSEPDLRFQFVAASAAMLQLALVVAGIGTWRLGEIAVAIVGRRVIRRGARPAVRVDPGRPLAVLLVGVAGLGLLAIAHWSFAGPWRFPAALPHDFTLDTWRAQGTGLATPALLTAALALLATLVALLLALACLENERRHGIRPGAGALWLIYVPLLVPQTAFLFGMQAVLIRLGLDGTWTALVWTHLVFVLPYLFLTLSESWRRLDPRYARTAACLGARPGRIFVAVVLPMLLRPILVAFAVGFAVSAGLYLPTLFAGAGRFATLTTEAVTLAGSADRRVVAAFALLQAALPLAVYAFALLLPALLFRHRRGLRGAA